MMTSLAVSSELIEHHLPQKATADPSNPQQGTASINSDDMSAGQQNDSFEADQGPSSPLKVPPSERDERKLFVGGLPTDVTSEEFHSFFAQFGEVVDTVVMFDRETGRSRGFGFVTYVQPEVARNVVAMGDSGVVGVGRLVMRGKTCEVKPAQPKARMTSPPKRKQGRRSDPVAFVPVNHYNYFPVYPSMAPHASAESRDFLQPNAYPTLYQPVYHANVGVHGGYHHVANPFYHGHQYVMEQATPHIIDQARWTGMHAHSPSGTHPPERGFEGFWQPDDGPHEQQSS